MDDKDIEKISRIQNNSIKRYMRRDIGIIKFMIGKITPMLIMAVIVTVFLKFSISLSATQEYYLVLIEKIVISIFAFDLITDFIMSKSKTSFFRKRWWNFIIFLPLLGSLGRLSFNAIKTIPYAEALFIGEGQTLIRSLDSGALGSAIKTSHVTNVSRKFASSSYILEHIRDI